MFLSKIWFFLVALAAAIGLTVALVMPRPAQRAVEGSEHARLTVACTVVGILLADEARNRVDIAGSFARHADVVDRLLKASNANAIDGSMMKDTRSKAEDVMKGIAGRQPDFAMLVDRKGRVVARVKLDEDDFGDVVAGRPLVDDALAGYLRDDLWAQNGTMYFVSAAPVIKRDPPVEYVGAVVLGHKVTNDLAQRLVTGLDADLGFFLGNDDVAGSKPATLDHPPMLAALAKLTDPSLAKDCSPGLEFDLHSKDAELDAMVARLPGEARTRQAFYTVYIKKPPALGFTGTLDVVRKSDLSMKTLIIVGAAFLIALGLGIAFMWIESDRPLRRLSADAVKLAKNESERLSEDAHGGKFGSIARSVNIHIDKLGRDAKSARTNLDQLLGPAPEGSLGTIDLLAGSLPASRPGGLPTATAMPPPSDFKFHDPAPPPVVARPAPAPAAAPARPASAPSPMMSAPQAAPPRTAPRPPTPIPAPAPMATPPRGTAPAPAAQKTQPLNLDDDILGGSTVPPPMSGPTEDPYFKSVYEQFVAVKKSCNENTSGLTYQKFAEKLVKNRDDLKAKTGCKEVRFTVYVKDGKAALKATPVKD